MNIYNRTLKASSEFFFGFEVEIDIRYFDTETEIINHFHKELLSVLKKFKFERLYDKCLNSKFHIHTHTFEQILLNLEGEIIYLCDHCLK